MLWVGKKPGYLTLTSFITQGFVLRVGLPFHSPKLKRDYYLHISCRTQCLFHLPMLTSCLYKNTGYSHLLVQACLCTICQGQMKSVLFLLQSWHLAKKNDSLILPTRGCLCFRELCSLYFLFEIRNRNCYLWVSSLPNPVCFLFFPPILGMEFSCL